MMGLATLPDGPTGCHEWDEESKVTAKFLA